MSTLVFLALFFAGAAITGLCLRAAAPVDRHTPRLPQPR
jgi:hypothetical protein